MHGSSEVQGHELDHSSTSASSRSRQHLKPFTELYAIARFTIDGPFNRDYKVKMINQIEQPTRGIRHSLCCTPFNVPCKRHSTMDVIDGRAKK